MCAAESVGGTAPYTDVLQNIPNESLLMTVDGVKAVISRFFFPCIPLD